MATDEGIQIYFTNTSPSAQWFIITFTIYIHLSPTVIIHLTIVYHNYILSSNVIYIYDSLNLHLHVTNNYSNLIHSRSFLIYSHSFTFVVSTFVYNVKLSPFPFGLLLCLSRVSTRSLQVTTYY